MPEPNDLSPELTPFVSALRDLAPATGELSRDRLLFEAGRASVVPACRWPWPVAAAGFALLSIVFAGLLAFAEPRVHVVERDRLVYVQVPPPGEPPRPATPTPAPPAEPAPLVADARPADGALPTDGQRMAALRRDVLRWGIEILPEPRPAAVPAPPRRNRELEDLLRPVPGAYAAPYLLPFRPPLRSRGDD